MSVKKLLVLSAAGVAALGSVAAVAGGPDVQPMPAPSYQGFYIQGDIGYAVSNWRGVFNAAGLPVTSSTNGSGGFAVGGSVGYQWSRYLAAEFGGFYNSRTTINGIVNNNAFSVRFTNWFLYLAAKLMAPLPWVDNLDIYVKGGLAYRVVDVTNGNNNDYLRPLAAVGLQYNINDQWYVKGQWMHVTGVSSNRVPPIDQFTFGVGYKFNV